ncbi:MAG: tRNA uridine-5-carboxymethylaminomethyl(34) synthesis GTPase MnmE [Fibrobacter sp.]|nr:tRNA uridine-5-carboxymethylaminomethyl(34) synthesis GTPase MnmE [Fibrobacteraceae bacterium]MCF0225495.1 tRNA uridine-5-carboxymethylaminomethyl(34) synthesis GTPase MnmE [Fibrobacter sp.]
MNQTIVAPMTPSGVSAVAAIRVSGTKVRHVVHALFGEFAEKSLQSHKAKLATAKDPGTGETIDSLLYLFFEGPNSYTGEDVLELYPHGNPLIVKELLTVIRRIDGVRLAHPGEFTRRSFLNGKMDLVQAESVAEVIHSANRAELKNAHRLLKGVLSRQIEELTKNVLDISARLELDVDFAEEEADPDYGSWQNKILVIREHIQKMIRSFKNHSQNASLPLVVIYGAPNAGKSSLVNALLGEDRILVSEIAGTTRDFVEVRLLLDNGEIRLIDTAGISENPQNELDALGMQKSKEILEEASLRIYVLDSSKEISAEECEKIKDALDRDAIVLLSKSDIAVANELELHRNMIAVSAKTNEGIDKLTSALNKRLFAEINDSEDLWITSEREKDALEEALQGVDRALSQLRKNPQVELIAFEMQVVRRALQTITGEISSEDVLQSIFAGFCIGK